MTLPILTQVENTAAWIVLVLIIAFILGAVWAVVDAALGYASARLVHSGNVVSIEERRRQLKAASGQVARVASDRAHGADVELQATYHRTTF